MTVGLAGDGPADSGVIRLRPAPPPSVAAAASEASADIAAEPRRGFDYSAFESRLESLWFQRKALLEDGRDDDAARQAELIRSFCAEEGIQRLEHLADALLLEAADLLDDGAYTNALNSLSFAEAIDPGNAQIRLARAAVYWRSGRGYFAAGGQLLAAVRAAVVGSIRDLTLFNQVALLLFIGVMVSLFVFSLLMVARYQIAFRHEVDERLRRLGIGGWIRPAGWALLFLPFLLWFAAGWIALYWILITFRFMRRAERLTAVALLIIGVLSIPGYRVAVTLYGMTADPLVRTTLAAAAGEYSPDRIIKLRRLVHGNPEDPTYRFLLAGLFKNGRYFSEAFAEYKEALRIDPSLEQAHVNIGNIFYTTGQYAEAVVHYNRALESNPNSLLALYNAHLAQSESFRFKEADASLSRARQIDAKEVTRLLANSGENRNRTAVIDAHLQMTSVWDAAIDGRTPNLSLATARSAGAGGTLQAILNPASLISLVTLLAAGVLLGLRRHAPARRCIRCGQAFCHLCKSSREAPEYCSHCLHLFVLGDGLAPEAKNHKLYEIERYERRSRAGRSLLSLVLPGAGQVLRGKAAYGTFLLLLWFAALLAWQPSVALPFERAAGIDLRLDLLKPLSIPARFELDPVSLLGLAGLVGVWLAGNLWRWRGREALAHPRRGA